MISWLRGTSWFQRIALALLAAGLVRVAVGLAVGGSTGPMFLAIAALLALFAFRGPLLWRVRNRLAVTYFLFGVVPILLICVMLQLFGVVALSQYTAERMRLSLNSRIAAVRVLADDLLLAASYGAPAQAMEEIRRREPALRAVVRTSGKVTLLPAEGGVFSAAPANLELGFQGLFEAAGKYFLGARLKGADGKTEAFAYLPLDQDVLTTLSPGIAVAGMLGGSIGNEPNINVEAGLGGSTVMVERDGERTEMTLPHVPPARNALDVTVVGILPWKVNRASGKTDDVTLVGLSRPSVLLQDVVTGKIARIALLIIVVVAAFLLVVEIASLIFTVSLTRTITRSVHDLYEGTLHIASNDFAHRIPVRGRHQLSELAASFNGMTAQIGHYIGEMRKKEKLESELEIAREVQARLFPRTVPVLNTLELAGICLPGRFVSGDYYDFVRLDDRYTAIALGDVSGKGVSAALLMASIQSSLHAQLKFSGAAPNPTFSTATLMALISQQLYENTPMEKYATFFCSVYDDQTGALRYTNCGHLKPILVRQGQVTALGGGGLVMGLLPNVSYEQCEVQLEPGDLLAIFSDGVSEAEAANEDQFGEARLGELLGKHAGEPLEKIIEMVTEAVRVWTHDPDGRDDTTLVLARRK